MQLRALVVLGFLVALRAASAADQPALEFSGVLVADGKTKIALTDKATGTTTWLEPGKDFHGYVIARYDAKADSVVLKKNGQEYPLTLVAAKVAPNAATPAALVPAAAPVASTPPTSAEVALTPTGQTASTPATPNTGAAANNTATPPTQTAVNISVTPPAVAADPGYVTKEGDTLTKISAATGLSLERLQELNPGVNPTALLKGGDPIRTR
jgi:LysM repeat protein